MCTRVRLSTCTRVPVPVLEYRYAILNTGTRYLVWPYRYQYFNTGTGIRYSSSQIAIPVPVLEYVLESRVYPCIQYRYWYTRSCYYLSILYWHTGIPVYNNIANEYTCTQCTPVGTRVLSRYCIVFCWVIEYTCTRVYLLEYCT